MPPNEVEVGNEEIIYICSECDPDPELDQNTIVLFNLKCDIHGHAWHRQMVRHANGTIEATYVLDKKATKKLPERETGASDEQSKRQKRSGGKTFSQD